MSAEPPRGTTWTETAEISTIVDHIRAEERARYAPLLDAVRAWKAALEYEENLGTTWLAEYSVDQAELMLREAIDALDQPLE